MSHFVLRNTQTKILIVINIVTINQTGTLKFAVIIPTTYPATTHAAIHNHPLISNSSFIYVPLRVSTCRSSTAILQGIPFCFLYFCSDEKFSSSISLSSNK